MDKAYQDRSRTRRRRTVAGVLAIALALLIAAVSLVLIRLATRESIQTYRMDVAFDGNAPWGEVGPELEGEKHPTVLYRRVGNSYCYTAFQSEELRDILEREGVKQVVVQYNVFTNFGREGKYTLRSIDGVLLADGKRTVKHVEEFGGQILLSDHENSSCP
jgi:hypothetical protein